MRKVLGCVLQGLLGVIQDLKSDVQHVFFKLQRIGFRSASMLTVCQVSSVCMCVFYLSIAPGKTPNIIPAPCVNDSILIHDVFLQQTFIREVNCVI